MLYTHFPRLPCQHKHHLVQLAVYHRYESSTHSPHHVCTHTYDLLNHVVPRTECTAVPGLLAIISRAGHSKSICGTNGPDAHGVLFIHHNILCIWEKAPPYSKQQLIKPPCTLMHCMWCQKLNHDREAYLTTHHASHDTEAHHMTRYIMHHMIT